MNELLLRFVFDDTDWEVDLTIEALDPPTCYVHEIRATIRDTGMPVASHVLDDWLAGADTWRAWHDAMTAALATHIRRRSCKTSARDWPSS